MKKLYCLIIEDTEKHALILKDMLNQLTIFQQIDWCQNTTDALGRLVTVPYDLIFLDMCLPDQVGIDFLREVPRRPPVIVVTSHINYAEPCYDLDIIDFVSKPIEKTRLLRAITRALSGRPIDPNTYSTSSLFLKANRQMKKFYFSDVHFIEANGAYAKVHTAQGVILVSQALSLIEPQLPTAQFFRIQKSFIINMAHITAVDAQHVWINETKLSVGLKYIDQLKQIIGRGG